MGLFDIRHFTDKYLLERQYMYQLTKLSSCEEFWSVLDILLIFI